MFKQIDTVLFFDYDFYLWKYSMMKQGIFFLSFVNISLLKPHFPQKSHPYILVPQMRNLERINKGSNKVIIQKFFSKVKKY